MKIVDRRTKVKIDDMSMGRLMTVSELSGRAVYV